MIFADPQQPATTVINLIDNGEIAMALVELHLVHADGGDAVQAAVHRR